ncbi:hypothetical protein G3I24_33925, partial [Micromonospora aurantiaca]|nr:hypothetical protein [Micromonospora aurantiaca]
MSRRRDGSGPPRAGAARGRAVPCPAVDHDDAETLEIVVDPARPSGRTLLADGVEQSYVDVADARYLHFEYVRRIAAAIDVAAPRGAPLTALHLGGGALTLPRWLART